MQVSAIGGIGAGAAGGVSGAAAGSAAGAATAGSAASGSIEGTFLQGTTPAGPEALTDVSQNCGDVNLLFTLLILALLDKGDEKGGGVAGALSILAGLSLASQLGQTLGNQLGQSIAETSGAGGLGSQLDVSG